MIIMMATMMMMMMAVGSAVATYSSLIANPAVISHSFRLYVKSVSLSVARMTAVCRERYHTVITEQLLSVSRQINYQICTKSLCSYMSGTLRAGARISGSSLGNLYMYVAIDTSALSTAVKFDYNPTTVTYRFSSS